MNDYYSNSRPDVRREISGKFDLALDVGCGEGHVGKAMMDAGQVAAFHGIEFMDDAASAAEEHYSAVWHGSVEDCLAAPDFLGSYDLILCADVLEHLLDPWSVLADLATHLTPTGRLVISVPNIRFAPVMANLLIRGRFRYQESGVLDRTHLRFFTRDSLPSLVEGAGLRVERLVAKKSDRPVMKAVAKALGDFGSAQFTIIAGRS